MNKAEKAQIIRDAQLFFSRSILPNHLKNTEKLSDLNEFTINPFLVNYLAGFLEGKNDSKALAKVLILPRILGTSINTSFGTLMQTFCSTVLKGFGSGIPGIDLEFTDCLDNRKKYCQLKAGPNTINKDDIETMRSHFLGLKNRARTNKLNLSYGDLIIGVVYGTPDELSYHYQQLAKEYPVFVGNEFWYRLTGDKMFYNHLIMAVFEATKDTNAKGVVANTIDKLAREIEKNPDFFKGSPL